MKDVILKEMKLKKTKLVTSRLVVGLVSLITGTVLGITITAIPSLSSFTLPKLALLASKLSQYQPQQVAKVDVAAEKKQKLEKFYSEISTATDKRDWSKLYELVPQSVRSGVSKSEFIAYNNSQSEKNKTVSEQTIVNNIQVNGDSGIVDRTRVICLSKECTGDNRKEENAKREYVYIDGKWQ